MPQAIVEITGTSPLMYGAPITSQKQDNERDDDFDNRCWRERAHSDAKGNAILPALAWKLCLDSAAKRLGRKVKGKGRSTFGKIFQSSIMVVEDTRIGQKISELEGMRRFVPANGQKGSGTRVWRTFPIAREWSTTVTFHILCPEITQKVLEDHLAGAGLYCGMGSWSPRSGGYYGRFKAEITKWISDQFAMATPVEMEEEEAEEEVSEVT